MASRTVVCLSLLCWLWGAGSAAHAAIAAGESVAGVGENIRSARGFFEPPPESCALQGASRLIAPDTRALVILDSRLHQALGRAHLDYVEAAARRRQFRIAVLPIAGLDDLRPPELREAIRQWRQARVGIEGVLFVGNVKLPSFFLPRADIPSTRLWAPYYEDIDMVATRQVPPGTVLTERQGPGPSWPAIAGRTNFTVPDHDFDFLAEGPEAGPELWAAFLPVGFQEERRNTWQEWAGQLLAFFKKARAFHEGTVAYRRGLYLVSNDLSLLARSQPAWDAVGPAEIEFFAINEAGPGAFKNNPAGYRRAPLEKYPSLRAFLDHARTLPWMDEGWQNDELFLRDMARFRRRVVWWNVHSNPEWSLISWQQARGLREGGLIALLNGCSAAGFRQPGSRSHVDTPTPVERNVLANLVYGESAFIAALGSTHDRVNDERATPLLDHLYGAGYLGRAHLQRLRRQHRDVGTNTFLLREFQELLLGDPFADAR